MVLVVYPDTTLTDWCITSPRAHRLRLKTLTNSQLLSQFVVLRLSCPRFFFVDRVQEKPDADIKSFASETMRALRVFGLFLEMVVTSMGLLPRVVDAETLEKSRAYVRLDKRELHALSHRV